MQTYHRGAENEDVCNLWFILKTVIKIIAINVINITLFATAFLYIWLQLHAPKLIYFKSQDLISLFKFIQ